MEPGRYKAVAVDFDLGVNENTGTDQAAILFAISEGEPCEGETITGYLYFTEKTSERSIQTLRKMGWTGMDVGAITVADLPVEMELVIAEEEYNDQIRTKVQYINGPGEGGPALKSRMNDAQRTAFSERMRGLAMKTAPQQAAPAPRQATGARPAGAAPQAAPARQAAPAQRAAPAARQAAPAQRRQAPPPPAPLDDEDPLPF